MIQIYFSDFFGVSRSVLEKYGAFNVSLINDLPLFVDPFLLFNSEKKEYRNLHNQIIQYLQFLRDKSLTGQIKEGLLRSWFTFPEVKQNWLGYSKVGNIGSGLSTGFAQSLHGNLHTIFSSFGNESITMNSHLEKLCLIESGVGRDKISDFTTNLIKDLLLVYTEQFAQKYIDESLRHSVVVNKVRFNYRTESWENREFDLPVFRNDFVILTPKDILTKDETWINRDGLHHEYYQIARSIPNEQLRAEVNNYFLSMLPKDPSGKDEKEAIERVIRKFPQLIEYYIRYKEDRGDEAVSVSNARVEEAEIVFVQQVSQFVHTLASETDFYVVSGDTHEEAMKRVLFLKDIIENKGGHRIFYAEGKPIRRESDLHILFS